MFCVLMRRCVCQFMHRSIAYVRTSDLVLTYTDTTNKILYSLRENKLFLSTLNGVRGCIKNIFEFNYFQKYWIKNVFVIVFKKILFMRADNYLSAPPFFYMKIFFGFNVYFSMKMLYFPPCFSISLCRNIEWGPGKKSRQKMSPSVVSCILSKRLHHFRKNTYGLFLCENVFPFAVFFMHTGKMWEVDYQEDTRWTRA